jgi:hypothetical protein
MQERGDARLRAADAWSASATGVYLALLEALACRKKQERAASRAIHCRRGGASTAP